MVLYKAIFKGELMILRTLKKDYNKTIDKINHPFLYNLRNFLINIFVKIGLTLDFSFPFIVSAVILLNSSLYKNNRPFVKDDIKDFKKVETIDTSNGIHEKNYVSSIAKEEELFEHSTKWYINSKGFYERIVTSYIVKDLDLSDTKKVFSMSYEEISDKLQVRERKIITKKSLTKEDDMYNEQVFIITKRFTSKDDYSYRSETAKENIKNSAYYIILTLIMGLAIKYGKDKVFNFYLREKLNKLESLYHKIDIYEYEQLEKSLQIKKQNIDLLTDELPRKVKIKKKGI